MTTASNMVEIPRELLARLVAALETPLDLDEQDVNELIEDVQAYFPDGIELEDADA
jgi:transcriptional regulatory protein LevR